MKQRLGIAAALLGDPELLVLDEPTNGLDPVGITEMRDLIGRLSGGDRTVLVSSHLLSELEHVCDWLLIIDGGRLVYAGEREGFSGRGGTEIVLGPLDPADLLPLADLVAAHGHDAGREGAAARARRPRAPTRPTSRRSSTARPRRRASRSPRCTSAGPRSSPATSACSKETPDDPFLPCRARQAPATARRARRAALLAVVFAVGSTIIVLSAVKPAAETIPALRGTATIEALGGAGGGIGGLPPRDRVRGHVHLRRVRRADGGRVLPRARSARCCCTSRGAPRCSPASSRRC